MSLCKLIFIIINVIVINATTYFTWKYMCEAKYKTKCEWLGARPINEKVDVK
jgi:hypothetical protein